ncbi:hypothetical protein NLX71_22400 [Paenibacillus sp. MZ04-78.2]|uniref:hypothetical protein n=1 Tax=Paenibacillus sp. MZ04-78.2 TaxID=2962034 RepID=UPI0020B6BB8A|nr:hypothetical protein [Paenibacillus sp. MZ04-78.2]MCP3776018.1 hypothetical protein [Paenibacillus sp. MZ04-78.2]
MTETCPRCDSKQTVKDGKRYSRVWDFAQETSKKTPIIQQHFCHHCKKHFNKPIGVRFRSQKSMELQLKFFQLHFIEKSSARQCASILGIGKATAQRWRKQWLAELKALESYPNPHLIVISTSFSKTASPSPSKN